MDPGELSRKRAEVIMKVNCGLMKAAEAAKELGISRKTYYEWEEKGLAGLLKGLTDQKPGRPLGRPDPRMMEIEKALEKSREENERLRRQMALKDLMDRVGPASITDRSKKK